MSDRHLPPPPFPASPFTHSCSKPLNTLSMLLNIMLTTMTVNLIRITLTSPQIVAITIQQRPRISIRTTISKLVVLTIDIEDLVAGINLERAKDANSWAGGSAFDPENEDERSVTAKMSGKSVRPTRRPSGSRCRSGVLLRSQYRHRWGHVRGYRRPATARRTDRH